MITAFGEEIWNRLVADLEGRQLSRAEAARLETAVPYALEELKRCLDEGRVVNDTFRDSAGGDRTEAEQVLEAGILAAAESHDPRKAEYIGRLIGRIAFASKTGFGDIGPAEAFFLISTARQLSYRQLVLLALIHEGENRSRFRTGQGMVLGPLLMEVDDLYRRAVIAQHGIPVHPLQLEFAELHVTDNGVVLYDLMVLSALDDAHKRETLAALEMALWRNLRNELDRMHLVTLATSHGTVAQRTELTHGQRRILKALDLPEPPRFYDFTPATTTTAD